jgi:hypothetical protein
MDGHDLVRGYLVRGWLPQHRETAHAVFAMNQTSQRKMWNVWSIREEEEEEEEEKEEKEENTPREARMATCRGSR